MNRYTLAAAKRKNLRRRKFARVRDSKLRNQNLVKRTERKRFHLWFKHPGRYDLQGLDTPRKRRRRVIDWAKQKLGITTKSDNSLFSRFLRRDRRVRGPMNIGLQNYRLGKLAQRHGVARDSLDIRALVDSRLRYRENRANILPKIRILSSEPHEVSGMVKRFRVWREDSEGIY